MHSELSWVCRTCFLILGHILKCDMFECNYKFMINYPCLSGTLVRSSCVCRMCKHAYS